MVKKKRIVSKLILALVVLTAVSFCFLGSTFARYTSGGESTASVSVAEWNVSFEGDGVSAITFSQLSPAKDAWASETDGEERTHSTGSVKAIAITNSGDVAADVTVTVGTLTVTTDGTSYDGTYFDGVSEGENPAQTEVEGLFSVGFGYATTAGADAATETVEGGTITRQLAANGGVLVIFVEVIWTSADTYGADIADALDTWAGEHVTTVGFDVTYSAVQASELPSA